MKIFHEVIRLNLSLIEFVKFCFAFMKNEIFQFLKIYSQVFFFSFLFFIISFFNEHIVKFFLIIHS